MEILTMLILYCKQKKSSLTRAVRNVTVKVARFVCNNEYSRLEFILENGISICLHLQIP